jgi:hypothetical protein
MAQAARGILQLRLIDHRQLAVAIGGAIQELPKETAPVRMELRAE